MSTGEWGDDAVSKGMYASASDHSEIYQAGRDQHITENHFHVASPPVFDPYDDDEDEDDSDYGYVGADGWYHLGTVALFIASLLPVLVGGTSIRVVYSTSTGPAFWWGVLYTAVTFAIGASLSVLGLSRAIDRTDWSLDTSLTVFRLGLLLQLGLFVYGVVRDPAHAGSIG
ncbi:hypothetical protein C3486_09340 [Streptomyces sp. Ru73]|uniref:hypothetical protein n=1 Tax=Streptomyces sp. Ru73 TaxID=2080748 RepID=UPI000CDDDA7E|nr:hypothetical protein [Streptomyces sp. Ru73]POX41427.1 hypothetical protein C3486_09340 [Streptomyces sp. Ru73]